MKQVEVTETCETLAEIVDYAVRTGEVVTLTRNGDPIADIIPRPEAVAQASKKSPPSSAFMT